MPTIKPMFRVTKAGKDFRSTDPNDFVFREDLATLKVKATGTLTSGQTYSHGLGYIPIFFAMVKYSSTKGGLIGQDTVGTYANSSVIHAGGAIKYYVIYEAGI